MFDTVPDGVGFAGPAMLRWHRSNAEATAEMVLVILVAGVVAEAKRRRWRKAACWLGGGWDDWLQAKSVADWLQVDVEEAIDVATSRARALLRSPGIAKAMTCIAQALEPRHLLAGGEIDAFCRDAFGGRAPAPGAWSGSWPPTTGLLQEGLVPVFDDGERMCLLTRISLSSAHSTTMTLRGLGTLRLRRRSNAAGGGGCGGAFATERDAV